MSIRDILINRWIFVDIYIYTDIEKERLITIFKEIERYNKYIEKERLVTIFREIWR